MTIMPGNGTSLSEHATHLFQNATTQLKNILSPTGPATKPADECVIYDRASTMDDTSDCLFESNGKKTDPLFKREPDLCEEEKFRACFIDCSCDCSVGAEAFISLMPRN